MRYAIIILIILTVPVLAHAATLKVPSQFPTIQRAINAAVNGDTVQVDDGTYVENIDFLGKAITVISVNGASVTVIDGGNPVIPDFGSVVYFRNDEGLDSVLEGFTVTNGSGTWHVWPGLSGYAGGGIYCDNASPTIKDNIIKNNVTKVGFVGGGAGINCDRFASPLITNNTISNNSSEHVTDNCAGGGILCTTDSNPNISNNVISNNVSDWGGGIYSEAASPVITDNTITGNTIDVSGGGILTYQGDPLISGNTITYNSASYGGGMQVQLGMPEITGNIVSDNTTVNWCGGIRLFNNNPLIANNTVSNNSAGNAGGMQFYQASPVVMNNIVTGNTSAGNAGGIHLGNDTSPTVMNNIISGNTSNLNAGGIHCGNIAAAVICHNIITGNYASNGGGIYCGAIAPPEIACNIIYENSATFGAGIYGNNSNLIVSNCTIFKNSATSLGGGIYVFGTTSSSSEIWNSIFWNNTSPNGPEGYVGGSSILSIDYSNVEGGKTSFYEYPTATLNWGTSMIDADPLFVDALKGDFHIRHHSPCCDTGNNSNPGVQPVDFEGDPRIAYGTMDMGADEFYTHLYWTGNGTPGGSVEIKFVGLPGTAPVGLCIGTGVLNPPIPSMWGDWYLAFPIIGPMDMGTITSPDGVLVLPGTLPATPPAPYSIPMQAIIGAELTNLSVLEVK